MIWLVLVVAKWCEAARAWLHPGDVAALSAEEAAYWRRGYAQPLDPQPAGPGDQVVPVRLRRKLLFEGQLHAEGALLELPIGYAAALLQVGAVAPAQPAPAPPAEPADPDASSTPAAPAPAVPAEGARLLHYKGQDAELREDGRVVDRLTREDYADERSWKASVTRRLKDEWGG